MRKNIQRSSATAANRLARFAIKKAPGLGVRAQIEKQAAMPEIFPSNDGIYFDPKLAGRIIARGARKVG